LFTFSLFTKTRLSGFGVTEYKMLYFSDMTVEAQVISRILFNPAPPVSVQDLPPDCPMVLAIMMSHCLIRDAQQRPTFKGKLLQNIDKITNFTT